MKRFFLIPLMTLVCSVMAWGTEIVVNNFNDLKTALSSEGTADVVKLGADIAYPSNGGSDLLDIQRSLTLDGNNHKLSGYAVRGAHTGQGSNGQYNKVTLVVNHKAAYSGLTVTLKNVEITENTSTATHTVGVFVYDGVDSLAIVDNSTLRRPGANSNATPLALYGESSTPLKILVRDSKVLAGESSYGIVVLKPIKAYFENSLVSGYSAMTFKLPLGLYPGNRWTVGFGTANIGARGSVINATNSNFEAPNVHSGASNGFGTFVFEEDGIDMNFTNCGFNAEALGNATQGVFLLNGWYVHKSRETVDFNITISGDNTHFNGQYVDNAFYACIPVNAEGTMQSGYGYENGWMGGAGYVESQKYVSCDINVTISGGTYAINPETYTFDAHLDTSDPTYANDPRGNYAASIAKTQKGFTIPSTHEVKEVKQGNVTVYRVVKKASAQTINDNVESEGAGNNPNTSFAVTENTILSQETTTAGYVNVSSNAALTVGGTNNQKLVVNNGLDVQDNAEVVVKAGSSLVIGEGGIISEKEANIILEASEGAEAVNFLLHPDIDVNATPKATYKFKSQARMLGDANYIWQRFGAPTCNGDVTMTWTADVKTALYAFNYSENKWEQFSPAGDSKQYVIDGDPFQCYLMTINANPAEDVEYTFTGDLMGNKNHPLEFVKGWNYYANSYTAPIDIKSFLLAIKDKFPGVSATVYVYKRNGDRTTNWVGVNLGSFAFGTPEVSKIPPMQAFILQLQNGEAGEKGSINYEENVYNPFMGIEPNHAPARVREESNLNGAYITVTDGVQTEELKVFESEDFSDEFDNGWDAEKFDNENNFSLYCQEGETKLSSLATNDLTDKAIAFNNKKAGEFTLKAVSAVGATIKIYDAVAKLLIELTEGAEYKFTAEAIDDAARFIINPSDAPSAIDNTEVVVKASKFMENGQLYIRRGDNVYTVQGQNVK